MEFDLLDRSRISRGLKSRISFSFSGSCYEGPAISCGKLVHPVFFNPPKYAGQRRLILTFNIASKALWQNSGASVY